MHIALPNLSTSTRPSDNEKLHKMVRMVVLKYQHQKENWEKVHVRRQTKGRPDLWQARFDDLVEFKKKHGHCEVPYICRPNRALGLWAKKQRFLYQQHQKWQEEIQTYRVSRVKNCIRKVRMDLLNEIGFVWNHGQHKWDFMFQKLMRFKKLYRHCNVPMDYSPDRSLGRWVAQQRFAIRDSMPNPSDEIVKRLLMLEWIGFDWGSPHKGPNGLKQLKLIAKRYKEHSEPPTNFEQTGTYFIIQAKCA